MRRIIVMGTTGSGKTTFARALAARLGVPHGDQDAWNHGPGWQETPLPLFRAQVAPFTAADSWVMDGNQYGFRLFRQQSGTSPPLPAPRPEPAPLPLASARTQRALQPIQSESV